MPAPHVQGVPFENDLEFHLATVLDMLGVSLTDEQTRDTPHRWAKFLLEYAPKSGPVPNIKTFPNDNYDEMVYDRCEFYSLCAHHMVQVYGTIHMAYIPGDFVLGLSKLSRIADYFARQPVMQESLTKTIADYFVKEVGENVAVKIEAKHFCKCARGIGKQEGRMITTQLRGVFRGPTEQDVKEAEYSTEELTALQVRATLSAAAREEFLGYCREADL